MSFGKSLSLVVAITLVSIGFAWAETQTPNAETNITNKSTVETKAPIDSKLLVEKDKNTYDQKTKEKCEIDKNGIEKCKGSSKDWSSSGINTNPSSSMTNTTTPSSQTSTYEQKTTVGQ